MVAHTTLLEISCRGPFLQYILSIHPFSKHIAYWYGCGCIISSSVLYVLIFSDGLLIYIIFQRTTIYEFLFSVQNPIYFLTKSQTQKTSIKSFEWHLWIQTFKLSCNRNWIVIVSEYYKKMPQSHILQTNPLRREEEAKNDNRSMTFRIPQT